MAVDPRAPVIVGVGQISHRADGLDDALEPSLLMARAIERAADDAGLTGVPDPDALRVVGLLSWRYRDPARFVAAALGITPGERGLTTMGGNSPQALVNLTAGEIQRGELDLAILTGAEASRTRKRARRAGVDLPWTAIGEDVAPDRLLGADMDMSHPAERARGVLMPVQVYPMFESAIRAAAGTSVEAHQEAISQMWARFSEVAAGNEYAWIRHPRTAAEIRTPGPDNRMIGFPYPKLMNANNDIDQGAALIICSAARAAAIGIPRDRWVFVHAGSDCHEHAYVSQRWDFADTPAIRAGGRAVLELAGIGIDDVGIIDLYSCFPSAVQLGAAALGLGLDRQLTRTGGLSFAGGPWNNYVMHAIATVVADARRAPDEWALVWANGGYATKHAFGVYSGHPPAHGYRHASPQQEIDDLPGRELAEPAEATGPAAIDAYTVMHDADGTPLTAFAACRTPDGRRAWGTSTDPDLAAAMCQGEWVGRTAMLTDDGTLRVD